LRRKSSQRRDDEGEIKIREGGDTSDFYKNKSEYQSPFYDSIRRPRYLPAYNFLTEVLLSVMERLINTIALQLETLTYEFMHPVSTVEYYLEGRTCNFRAVWLSKNIILIG
jgi:hypothetical protein